MAIQIENKNTSLYTMIAGEQHHETVILLHGGPGVPEDQDELMEFLATKYRVIYFHQRGTAYSPCGSNDFSMEAFISDIDAIAAHFGLQRFHLFGHSWGGLYAGIYAHEHPEKILSLFLCSPASGTGKQWAKMGWEVRRFNKRRSSFWEWVGMLRNSFLGTIGINLGHRRFFRQFGININKGYKIEGRTPLLPELVKAKAVNRTSLGILKHPEQEPLKTSYFGITITYGDDDIYGESTKYVRERYPTAKVITIPDASHNHWLHNKKFFYEVMARHFNRLKV